MPWLLPVLLALLAAAPPVSAQGTPALPSLTVTPAAITFTYQIGDAAVPKAQSIQVKRSGSGAALDYTLTLGTPAPWLIVSPLAGKTGTSVTLLVNPTSLLAGSYTTILQASATGASGPALCTVTFVVKAPRPKAQAKPAALTFDYATDAAGPPTPQTVTITTDGEPFAVTASVAGGAYLKIDQTVGIVASYKEMNIRVSVDPAGLLPGSYTKAAIGLATPDADPKTLSVPVTLNVTAGRAVLDSIWPDAIGKGSPKATITLRGKHLFANSVIKAATGGVETELTDKKWISTEVMTADIPGTLLVNEGTLTVTVTNPPTLPSTAQTFTVTPPGPNIRAIVNAASFSGRAASPFAASPGEIVTIFGSGLGPTTPKIMTAALQGTDTVFPTLDGTAPNHTSVEFEIPAGSGTWVAAPLLMISANQINCVVPFGVPVALGLKVRVNHAGANKEFTYDGAQANPGIFTTNASGRGQAAALNYNETTGTYTVNSGANAAPKGSVIVVYATGMGTITPVPSPQGKVYPADFGGGSPPVVDAVVAASIDGESAPVLFKGAAPYSVAGLMQLNIQIPNTVKAGKELSLVVAVNGISSPGGVTIAVK